MEWLFCLSIHVVLHQHPQCRGKVDFFLFGRPKRISLTRTSLFNSQFSGTGSHTWQRLESIEIHPSLPPWWDDFQWRQWLWWWFGYHLGRRGKSKINILNWFSPYSAYANILPNTLKDVNGASVSSQVDEAWEAEMAQALRNLDDEIEIVRQGRELR